MESSSHSRGAWRSLDQIGELDFMSTRRKVLLLVGVVHLVVVRTAITKMLVPYVRIIKIFYVCCTIYQMPMYGLLESVFGVKTG